MDYSRPIQVIEDAYKCPYCESKTFEIAEREINDAGDQITIHYECLKCDATSDLDFTWNEEFFTPYDGTLLGGIWWPPSDYWE